MADGAHFDDACSSIQHWSYIQHQTYEPMDSHQALTSEQYALITWDRSFSIGNNECMDSDQAVTSEHYICRPLSHDLYTPASA